MFDQFVADARKIVVLCRDEALVQRRSSVDVEHLLLAVLDLPGTVGYAALERCGVSIAALRDQLDEPIAASGAEQPAELPFSPGAKKALALSQRQSFLLGHHHIGPEHLLLGLLAEGGDAAQVLGHLGVDLRTALPQVTAEIAARPGYVAAMRDQLASPPARLATAEPTVQAKRLFRRTREGHQPATGTPAPRQEPEGLADPQAPTWFLADTLIHNLDPDRLVKVHDRLVMPPLNARAAEMVTGVERWLLSLYRVLPDHVVRTAEARLTQVVESGVLRDSTPCERVALALARLRQKRYADVADLCGQVEAPSESRALALAMVQVARQEQGQSYQDVTATAAAAGLDLADSVVSIRRSLARDQVAADFAGYRPDGSGPSDPARTERLLAAYRAGDRLALYEAGRLGHMLLAEGRIPELQELHGAFPMPPGPDARSHAAAMANLSYSVLLDPAVGAAVAAEAESRVRWALDNLSFEGTEGALGQEALRHTIALARLRQGQFDEVEDLCTPRPSGRHLDGASRASVLATIVLARQALRQQPYENLLDEAVRLAPDGWLVKEASDARLAGRDAGLSRGCGRSPGSRRGRRT